MLEKMREERDYWKGRAVELENEIERMKFDHEKDRHVERISQEAFLESPQDVEHKKKSLFTEKLGVHLHKSTPEREETRKCDAPASIVPSQSSSVDEFNDTRSRRSSAPSPPSPLPQRMSIETQPNHATVPIGDSHEVIAMSMDKEPNEPVKPFSNDMPPSPVKTVPLKTSPYSPEILQESNTKQSIPQDSTEIHPSAKTSSFSSSHSLNRNSISSPSASITEGGRFQHGSKHDTPETNTQEIPHPSQENTLPPQDALSHTQDSIHSDNTDQPEQYSPSRRLLSIPEVVESSTEDKASAGDRTADDAVSLPLHSLPTSPRQSSSNLTYEMMERELKEMRERIASGQWNANDSDCDSGDNLSENLDTSTLEKDLQDMLGSSDVDIQALLDKERDSSDDEISETDSERNERRR